jgi:solute carrier family 25 (mitochondrial carnitine/acylcarnitine transporter), member 20/29
VTLQTQDFRNPMYKGTYDCIKKIIQRDSIKGLYRGLSSPMASISVLNAIVFGVYGNVQRNTSNPDSILTHFYAGSAAGIAQTVICSPMELVKSRLQVQNDMPNATVKHKGPVECMKYIYKNEGFRGVFKGYGITVARDFPGKFYIFY